MIRDYVSLAANERTYLAWVRTGIAIIALGFVIEKFDLFAVMVSGTPIALAHSAQLARLVGPAGRYGGTALAIVGILLIVLATARFVRTEQLLADGAEHPRRTALAGALVMAGLTLMAGLFSAYLAWG